MQNEHVLTSISKYNTIISFKKIFHNKSNLAKSLSISTNININYVNKHPTCLLNVTVLMLNNFLHIHLKNVNSKNLICFDSNKLYV